MSHIPSQYIAPSVCRVLDDSLFLIISKLLATRPAVIHDSINTGVYALLLSGTIPDLSGDVKQDVSLSTLFYQAELHPYNFKKNLWPKFFLYITTASPEEAKHVVEHLLRRCVSLAEPPKKHDARSVVRYFLFLASQVLTAHSSALDCFFPPEIHFILDGHSSSPYSDILICSIDDISSIASHLRKALPHITRLPPPLPLLPMEISPDLLRYTLVEFLRKLAPCPDHSEARLCAQVNLYNLALVSRSWYSVAIGVLYAHPVLRQTSEDAQLFIRTMDSSPTLARLVRSVELRPPRTVHQLTFLANRSEGVIPFPMSSLRQCENLTTLSSDTLSWASNTPHQQYTLCDLTLVASRLRVLHLTGIVTETVILHLSLPSLEVLCLRDCTLPLTSSFQPLRKLHTFRLYQSQVVGDSRSLESLLFRSAFPNLQTCEILAWQLSELESSLGIFSRDRSLYPTSLGETSFRDPSRRIQNGEGPRSMTLGIIEDDIEWDNFKDWRIHPSLELESLTLVLGSSYRYGNPLNCVLEFLASNSSRHTLRALCLIYASCSNGDGLENPCDEPLILISERCASLCIKLELIPYCMYS